MSNIETTDIDIGGVLIRDGEYADGILDIAGAGTFKEGLILARDSVSLKLVPFVKGGNTNGNGIPKAVLPYDVVAATSADQVVRVLTGGVLNKERLIVLADGDASNVDNAVIDQLRDYGLRAEKVQQLSHNPADDDS